MHTKDLYAIIKHIKKDLYAYYSTIYNHKHKIELSCASSS